MFKLCLSSNKSYANKNGMEYTEIYFWICLHARGVYNCYIPSYILVTDLALRQPYRCSYTDPEGNLTRPLSWQMNINMTEHRLK